MNQGEIRRCKIHRRMNVLRNRYDDTWQYDSSDYWINDMYGNPASNGTCIRNSYG